MAVGTAVGRTVLVRVAVAVGRTGVDNGLGVGVFCRPSCSSSRSSSSSCSSSSRLPMELVAVEECSVEVDVGRSDDGRVVVAVVVFAPDMVGEVDGAAVERISAASLGDALEDRKSVV